MKKKKKKKDKKNKNNKNNNNKKMMMMMTMTTTTTTAAMIFNAQSTTESYIGAKPNCFNASENRKHHKQISLKSANH